MSALPIPDLARQYASWLGDRMLTVGRGTSQVLSTPFLDPFNDGIEIYVDGSGGEILLHDNGRTLDNLMDMGVQIEKSERRQQIISHAIAGCGVEWRDGRLQIDDLPVAFMAGFAVLFFCVASLFLLPDSGMRLIGVALLTFLSCGLAVALSLLPVWA